ncbi:MAG TPA: PqqD family protein [Thermoanaerobaculia bacterium]
MSEKDGAVLLDLHGGRYYSLNAVGALIWQKLADGVQVPQIEATLVSELGAPPERAAADVARFVSTLAKRKLVVAA